MSKKPAKETLSEQFTATSDLRDQVELAAPLARRSLWNHGLDVFEAFIYDDVQALAGTKEVFRQDQDVWFAYCEHVHAAFALGIAMGQLVNPDLLRRPTGGAR